MDNTIAYISGMVFTFFTTMQLTDIAMAAILGLIGGFFGIIGKEMWYVFKGILTGKDAPK